MKSKDFDAYRLLYLALGAAGFLALAYVLIFWAKDSSDEAARLGQLGDYFGGLLNPMISVLTLFVAISVWQLQKKEMAETREALDKQAETAKQQRQEQRFFDLLNVYFRTVESTRYSHHTFPSLAMMRDGTDGEHRDEIFEGKAAISNWLSRRTTVLSQYLQDKGSAVTGQLVLKPEIEKQWTKNPPDQYFDSYFRVVRHLLAEAQNLLGEQHHRYVALFRAQLSRTELVLLALHFWLDRDGQAAQHLAGKYGLLTNLPKGDLRTELEGEFSPELFTQPRVGAPEPNNFDAEDGH